jgi:hypothetical protein
MIADTAWVARIVEAGRTVAAELEDKHLVVASGSRIVAEHTVASAVRITAAELADHTFRTVTVEPFAALVAASVADMKASFMVKHRTLVLKKPSLTGERIHPSGTCLLVRRPTRLVSRVGAELHRLWARLL